MSLQGTVKAEQYESFTGEGNADVEGTCAASWHGRAAWM